MPLFHLLLFSLRFLPRPYLSRPRLVFPDLSSSHFLLNSVATSLVHSSSVATPRTPTAAPSSCQVSSAPAMPVAPSLPSRIFRPLFLPRVSSFPPVVGFVAIEFPFPFLCSPRFVVHPFVTLNLDHTSFFSSWFLFVPFWWRTYFYRFSLSTGTLLLTLLYAVVLEQRFFCPVVWRCLHLRSSFLCFCVVCL